MLEIKLEEKKNPIKKVSKVKIGCLGIFAFIFIMGGIGTCIDAEKKKKHLAEEEINLRLVEAEQLNQKDEFVKRIEVHYNHVQSLIESKNIIGALKVLELFEKHKQLSYKDIKATYTTLKTGVLLEKLATTPETDIKTRFNIYSQLNLLQPNEQLYISKLDEYRAEYNRIIADEERVIKFVKVMKRYGVDEFGNRNVKKNYGIRKDLNIFVVFVTSDVMEELRKYKNLQEYVKLVHFETDYQRPGDTTIFKVRITVNVNDYFLQDESVIGNNKKNTGDNIKVKNLILEKWLTEATPEVREAFQKAGEW
jgi:hypothetical protein